MYNIKFSSYIPEPRPAKTDRIVAAHYYAAWKKGAAEVHEGFDDLAEIYPDRTPLMGYYDEELPEVADWEIKWAVEHGINCFIYCWYRNLENTGKPVTENDLRCGHAIHEALFNAKYKNLMKFAIMFEAQERWSNTDSKDFEENLLPFAVASYAFACLRVEFLESEVGRPCSSLLIVDICRTFGHDECVRGAES